MNHRSPLRLSMLLASMLACALLGAVLSPSLRLSAEPPKDTSQSGQQAKPAAAESWLKGTTEEKLAQIERQLRGLDQSMAEIGYRYGELIVASKARNWEYAQYQTEKIGLSLQLALERRPKRAKSSQPFLNEDLPRVLDAVKKRDAALLNQAMLRLHDGCVQCHKSEKVLYFKESVERIRDRASR
jgi:hypothetical protein